MASKAARKRRRLEEERQQLAKLDASGIVHTRCSDVTLGELGVLLAQADELLDRIGTHAGLSRTIWPQVASAHELRATIEAVAAAAASARARLAAALERARRFQRSGVHVHLCGDLAVRMVPLSAHGAAPATASVEPDAHDEHANGGAGIETLPPDDDIPF